MKDSLSIIIQTCDRYSDIWNPFYTLFFKYWADCPYPIYHVSETKIFDHPRVVSISTGIGTEWSERLIIAAKQIKEKYTLLLLEDYFLVKKVSNDVFDNCIKILEDEDPSFLRIFPMPQPDLNFKSYTNIGLVSPHSPYAFSTQATIWDKSTLLSVLKPEETVWDFEIIGSKRAESLQRPLLSLKNLQNVKKLENGDFPYTYLCTAVYKGKWMKEAITLCKKEGIELDLVYRRVESNFEHFYRLYYTSMPNPIKHFLDFIKSRLYAK